MRAARDIDSGDLVCAKPDEFADIRARFAATRCHCVGEACDYALPVDDVERLLAALDERDKAIGEVRMLIVEVRRLRWFEENFDPSNSTSRIYCNWCETLNACSREGEDHRCCREETGVMHHAEDCEYVAHCRKT